VLVTVVTWYVLLDIGTRRKYCGSHWNYLELSVFTYLCVTFLKTVLFPGLLMIYVQIT
jgi:hypothetical protein